MCAQRFACVHVFASEVTVVLGRPELSSLMYLGGPEESRALEGGSVSAPRDLQASARITLFLWCQVKQ